MYKVLDKDTTIEMEIVPYIAFPKRDFALKVALSEIVNEVLYKMKTGSNRRPVSYDLHKQMFINFLYCLGCIPYCINVRCSPVYHSKCSC